MFSPDQHQALETAKTGVDGLSITILVSTFLGALPHIAAFFTAVWAIFRVYEMDTTKRIFKWCRSKLKKEQ